MQNEICCILIGKRLDSFHFRCGRLVRRRKGTFCSVKFDWKWALEREEKKGDVLGFYHTHSHGSGISGRDVKTMMAWASCFGKNLFCIIEDSSSGKNKTYVFLSHPDIIAFRPYPEVLRVCSLIIGVNP